MHPIEVIPRMTTLAPIVLFVYNRPAHTRRTVEALQKNELAGESDLFVFSDAPKTIEAAEAVREVREYVKTISGFRSVSIVERHKNWGLANSIIDGVTRLCREYGRVIVLEDDLVVSIGFLRYMNEALVFYQNSLEVMHISGCRYPVGIFGTDDTFFLQVPLCWGWATWQRAWITFEKDTAVMEHFDRSMIKRFNFDNTYSYWKQLELNRKGKINTWFVFWYANLFLQGGLSLFPSRSLVRNIGFDNSGTHCGESADYDVVLTKTPVSIREIPLLESKVGFDRHKEYFKKISPNFLKRVIRKLHSIFQL